jgi:hypothetical protein
VLEWGGQLLVGFRPAEYATARNDRQK